VDGNNPKLIEKFKQLENSFENISIKLILDVTRKPDMNTKYLAMVPALALLAACGGSATNTNIYSDTLGNPSTCQKDCTTMRIIFKFIESCV
jgi:hypothetical protein